MPFGNLTNAGTTLSGRAPAPLVPPPAPAAASSSSRSASSAPGASSSAPRVAPTSPTMEDAPEGPVDPWANLTGGGNTLSASSKKTSGVGAKKGKARAPVDVIEIDD